MHSKWKEKKEKEGEKTQHTHTFVFNVTKLGIFETDGLMFHERVTASESHDKWTMCEKLKGSLSMKCNNNNKYTYLMFQVH